MKQLVAWIAGSVALGIMLIGLPWNRLSCRPASCSMSTSYGTLGMFAIVIAIELAIPIAILTAIFVGVLGVRDANEPRDVAVMSALSVGVARHRRRDDATVAGLGAQPRTLRAAVFVEATVVAAFSIAVGLGWGTVSHAALVSVGFTRTSLGGVITDSYLHWTLSSIALVPLLVIGASAVLVFGVSAAIAARALQRRTPMENHRPVNSGVLS